MKRNGTEVNFSQFPSCNSEEMKLRTKTCPELSKVVTDLNELLMLKAIHSENSGECEVETGYKIVVQYTNGEILELADKTKTLFLSKESAMLAYEQYENNKSSFFDLGYSVLLNIKQVIKDFML